MTTLLVASCPTYSKKRSYKPPGVWLTSILPHTFADASVGVHSALGEVEEGARAHPNGAAFYQELVLSFEH